MSELETAYFLFQKDFSETGKDRYFVYKDNFFNEVEASYITDFKGLLITHDYWLIIPSIYTKTGKLPQNVIDVTEFAKAILGKKHNKKNRQETGIEALTSPYFSNKTDFKKYLAAFYRKEPLSKDNYMFFSHKLSECWEALKETGKAKGEWERYITIEFPLFNVFSKVSAKGIKLNTIALRNHKEEIHSDYFRVLKSFAIDFNLPFEFPPKKELEELLSLRGYNISDIPLEYILIIPMTDNFGERVLELRKLNRSRSALTDIPLSRKRVSPIVETHSSVTSRIYYKNPTIQNLAKKYRNIFIADEGYKLAYVDFDQFEVGIMASLSKDPEMKKVYTDEDVYKVFATDVFGDVKYRKLSKELFLSFTYGMPMKKILDTVYKNNGDKSKAKDFFNKFTTFIEWREKIATKFLDENRIETVFGNYLERTRKGELTAKEKRSCVSQVVQGTGSLIFKKALLELDSEPKVEILIPMHDAVLVQHLPEYSESNLIKIFENAMQYFLSDIKGKASIESFVPPEQTASNNEL